MRASDVDVVVRAVSRIVEACRSRGARDAESRTVVTDKQARILRQLDDRDPTMVGELAEFFGVTASTMSLNLRRLDDLGCVTRDRDPDDRRVMNVRLTDRGRRLRDASSPLDPSRVDAALRALRPEEREQALEGIALLADGADRAQARDDRYLNALSGGGG